jgi:hypothetical protein
MSPDDLRPFFEMLMVVSFGIAWPTSIFKSLRSKTAKGKSPVFMIYIWLGYAFGICAHLVVGEINYPLVFYFINIAMVTADFCLYWRNRNYDRLAEQEGSGKDGMKGGSSL